MGNILKGPGGDAIRTNLSGGFVERVIAHLAGDFTVAGHRVLVGRATGAVSRHAERVQSEHGNGRAPAEVARVIAQLERFDRDDALTKELEEERVDGESARSIRNPEGKVRETALAETEPSADELEVIDELENAEEG